MNQKCFGPHFLVLGLIAAVSAVAVLQGTSLAAIHHVDASSTTNGPGNSWSNAFNSLTTIVASADPGDEIRVAGGHTYKPGGAGFTFNITANGLKVIGGFAGLADPSNNVPDPVSYPTYLSGDVNGDDSFAIVSGVPVYTNYGENNPMIVRFLNASPPALPIGPDTVLQNFIVQGGKDHAIVCETNTKPTIRECIIRQNRNTSGSGAGIWTNTGSEPTIRNCEIVDNTASSDGGGLYATGTAILLNTTFLRNRADQGGGGMLTGQNSRVISCLFKENIGIAEAGGANITGGGCQVVNSLFHGNSAPKGGAIKFKAGTETVTNCTIISNSASNAGGGIYSEGSSIAIYNSILWDNTAPNSAQLWTISSTTIDRCNIQGGFTCTNCTNIMNSNPIFVDAPNGNYRLTCDSSPCINKGNNSAVPCDQYDVDENSANCSSGNQATPDLDLADRIRQIVDMGAYEIEHPCRADLNNDGVVNANDLLIVINNWDACPSPPAACPGDVASACDGTFDGTVNANDLLAVINNWGYCPGYSGDPVGAVPTEITDCMEICNEELDWGDCMDKCLCAIEYQSCD